MRWKTTSASFNEIVNENKFMIMTIKGKQMFRHPRKSDVPERVGCGNAAAGKLFYEKAAVTPVMAEVKQCILAGSYVSVRIENDEIKVKGFENDTVFPYDGFDGNFNF